MKFADWKISAKLCAGFSIVLTLAIIIEVISLAQMRSLANLTTQMYNHPLAVSNAVKDIKGNILAMQLSMKYIMAQNATEIDSSVAMIDECERNIHNRFDLIFDRFLGDHKVVRAAHKALIDWKPIRDEAIQLARNKDRGKSAKLSNIKSTEQMLLLQEKIEEMNDFANQKGKEFFREAQASRDNILAWMAIAFVVIFLLSAAVAMLITSSISSPINKITVKLEEIAQGDLDCKIDSDCKDEIGIMAKSFRQIQENLREKSEIAQAIAHGNFSQRVRTKGAKDQLAHAINHIADSFRKVVEQANSIAHGKYREKIIPKSENDELGIALCGMTRSLVEVVYLTQKIAQGDFSMQFPSRSQDDRFAIALNKMITSLRKSKQESEHHQWVTNGQNKLEEVMRGDMERQLLSRNIITFLCQYMDVKIGIFYIKNKQNKLSMISHYAYKNQAHEFELGEGIVGQAGLEKKIILLTNVPENYIAVSSGIGTGVPCNILVVPFICDNQLQGVMELGSLSPFNDMQMDFVEQAAKNIAIVLNLAASRWQMKNLLRESSEQAQQLTHQQKKLTLANKELEKQTQKLINSQEKLKKQREELQLINQELEEKNCYYEKQKIELVTKNWELEKTHNDLQEKARQLQISTKYKSEFLANMSHELRTPLNSLLILAKNLYNNKTKNLSEDQVESAEIIYNSGVDLLNLINNILDISKIEAGKISLFVEKTMIADIAIRIENRMRHVAKDKGIEFRITLAKNLPETLYTDAQKLEQVLKNLISNAVKFTERGSVDIEFYIPEATGEASKDILAISVRDTGIGISQDKQKEIFEAFQQVDGSISRKYRGSGLGLSISKEFAELLGGEIRVKSELGKGAMFTLFISMRLDRAKNTFRSMSREMRSRPQAIIVPKKIKIENDRNERIQGERVLLLVEDDSNFAKVLQRFCCQRKFKFLHTNDGESGIKLAQEHLPDAIILDLKLPGIKGWQVLDVLKNGSKTRHIPVYIMSAEDESLEARRRGAMSYLIKPVTAKGLEEVFAKIGDDQDQNLCDKKILLVDDDMRNMFAISKILEEKRMKVLKCANGEKALARLEQEPDVNLVLMDIMMPVMNGYEAIQHIRAQKRFFSLPIIALTAKVMKNERDNCMSAGANDYLSKPINIKQLLALMRMWLCRGKNE